MAVHDVDQKLLGRLASETKYANAQLSSALYQILGLSVILTKRLRRARRLRRLDPSRDTKSLELYHRIIWMSREGLAITELVLPLVETGQYGVALRIFAAKLRASFYHVFALFHNTPPVTQRPLTPSPYAQSQSLSPAAAQAPKVSPPRGGGNDQSHLSVRERTTALRDTIPSMTSEASYITNPYARDTPISPPPGLINRSTFILPSVDFVPMAAVSFKAALDIAVSFLPGSSPLRLTIALEYCAFLWDCMQDHEGSRRLASKTIREVYREQAGMDDQEFEDAADLVGTLGRMMRRKSNDPSPRIGAPSPTNPGRTGGVITSPTPASQSQNRHREQTSRLNVSQSQPYQTSYSATDYPQTQQYLSSAWDPAGVISEMPVSTTPPGPPPIPVSATIHQETRVKTPPSSPPAPPPKDTLPQSYTPPTPRQPTPKEIHRRPVASPSRSLRSAGRTSPPSGTRALPAGQRISPTQMRGSPSTSVQGSPAQKIRRKPVPPRKSPSRSPETVLTAFRTEGPRGGTPLLSRRSF